MFIQGKEIRNDLRPEKLNQRKKKTSEKAPRRRELSNIKLL